MTTFEMDRAKAAFHVTTNELELNVSVRLKMEEFYTWEPDRIKAFLGGIAEILKAANAPQKASENAPESSVERHQDATAPKTDADYIAKPPKNHAY
jgi:hypothetical protein